MQKYTTVDEFLDAQTEPRKSEVNRLRAIIRQTEPKLTERIKWNAPSYFLGQDDCITFNVHDPRLVRLILHAGATKQEDKKAPPIINDDSGLLEWNSNIRATILFSGLEDIESKKDELVVALKKWLAVFG